MYGNGSQIYINSSFCDEFRHINFLIRAAKKADKIFRWKIKNGVNFVKVHETDKDFVEVSHINDLVRMDIVDDSS